MEEKIINNNIKNIMKIEMERERFNIMCKYEKDAYSKGYKMVAGIDEAGRGPLAGPVVSAAVILPEDIFINGLNDSKKLSAKKRESLYSEILDTCIDHGIGIVDEKCIDGINILNATKKSMSIAVNALNIKPDMLFIDAVELNEVDIKQLSIIKGDGLSISIAAASIIAKVTRDRIMDEMHILYPQYGFINHKGYGTKQHMEAIRKYGRCPIHRTSFTKNIISSRALNNNKDK